MESYSIPLEEMIRIVKDVRGAFSATHTEMETTFFGNSLPLMTFKDCQFFVEKCSCPHSFELDTLKLDVRFHGGNISDVINEQVTHILIHGCKEEISVNDVKKPRKVNPDWLSNAIKTQMKMKELWFQL